MIICPNCQHNEVSGAIFCSECGAQLISADGLVTQNIKTDQIQPVVQQTAPYDVPAVTPTSPAAWISLHLLDSGQILPVTERSEFTIGRVSEGQPIMPDIDLTPYQAYANGVSRLHVVVRRDGQNIVLMDLGSANGTYLNGQRVPANVEQIVRHGDVLALGKLKMQILHNTP